MSSPVPPPKPPRRTQTSSPIPEERTVSPPKSPIPPPKPVRPFSTITAENPSSPSGDCNAKPSSFLVKDRQTSASPTPPPPPPRSRPITSSSTASTVSLSPSTTTTSASITISSEDCRESRSISPKSSKSFMTMSMSFKMPSIKIMRRNSSQTLTRIIDDSIIMQGLLSKRNREGSFDKCQFIITKDCVKYARIPLTSNLSNPPEEIIIEESQFRSIPLDSIIVTELEEGDYENCVKRERAFRFRSKVKSFLLKAKTTELRQEWMETISTAATLRRLESNIPTPDPSELTPIWQLAEVNACQICDKRFGLLVRKHHCRNCGRCVCEMCSNEKVRLVNLDPRALFKVCSHCAAAIKNERSYGV